MIVSPKTAKEWSAMAGFLQVHAGVHASQDMAMMGWVEQERLRIACGMHGFMGKVCQIHIAFEPDWTFSPRQMLHEVFKYAFITRGCELVLGVVNSKNEKAIRFDAHLGFKELYRIPSMHDDGGDIVLLGLRKLDCRYLKSTTEQATEVSA
jgi:hypothetical protein